jgi:PAS domain S-box-containing protein
VTPVFLAGGGGTGALMRAADWSATPLGAPDGWPAALKALVGVMLGSHQPMLIVWGPEHITLYNDGYAEMCGTRHPAALGRPFEDLWHDIWEQVEPILTRAYAGEATHMSDIAFTMHRNGYPEEAHFAFGYTPVRDGDGAVAGMVCACVETTRQVLAERRLRESEAQAKGVLEGMAEGFLLLDPEFRVMQINAEGLRLERRSAPEVVGRTLWQAYPGSEDSTIGGLYRHAMAERVPVSLTHSYTWEDGHQAWLEMRAHPAPDGGLAVFYRDVSDRVRADRAVSESETRFRNMADHAPVMMWVTDPDGACTYLNRRWYEYTGQTQATGLGLGWLDAVHPDDRGWSGETFLAANARWEAFRLEYRLRGADGQYRWFIDAADPRLGEDGTFLGYIGSVVDIHDRKLAEERLAEITRRLDAVLSNTTMAILMMDERQQCIYMNAAAETLTGYTLAETQGRPLHDVVHHTRPDGSPYPLCECPIDQALPENEQEQGEEIFVHKDGSFYPVAFTASPIRNDAGVPIGTVIEVRNIEQELRAKAQMDAFNATLEQRVTEEIAQREKAEEQLRQAQKMEAVGQLTGGIAHDFNNLLAGISGSLELLQSRMSQGRLTDVDRYIAAAQGASKRAAALTHRLLAFSRRQTLDPKPTDVNRLIGGMEDLLRRSVGPAVEVEVVGAAGLWPALVDPNQLENALLNLCINARDAMPDGGRITIETANKWLDERTGRERDLPPGQYLSLCVTDTGTGMTPEVIQRAFDPFFTTKPQGQGTGLGLSMIYGFARQSGGQVRIYSEVGQGTTMCLYLPRHYGDAQLVESGADLSDAPRAEQGETVLVVDDEPTVRMLVTEVLEELGYAAIEAADGASGLKVLQSDVRIDLLVTDVGLPGGMNGRQMADAARERRPDLKVLFITGYAENAAIGHGHLEPGMQVLTKPFAMEALASRIKLLIGGT